MCDVQDVIAMALGSEGVTNTVEGRERYTVNLRYDALIPSPEGPQVLWSNRLAPDAGFFGGCHASAYQVLGLPYQPLG